ncbi:MAG: sensor histidine kinase [Bacteroidales bacterium]|nr:sensor histidine kinase [Clostridium sp.]MCM1203531.1 sensor histidine kinase [Bacteroidales bacterium]
MMKKFQKTLRLYREYRLFFNLFLLLNFIFALFLWLTDIPSFRAVIGLFFGITVFCFAGILYIMGKREEKRRNAFFDFLENPDQSGQEKIKMLFGEREQKQLEAVGERLRENRKRLQEEQRQRKDYEEYIELWAHEIKVPLSLLTLLSDNRRDEMSGTVYQRLVYVENRIQDNVTQMLYYARLGAAHIDYLWEWVSLKECVEEAALQYEPVFREGGVKVICAVRDIRVYTDKKGFLMILGQVLNNAHQYRDAGKKEQWIRVSDGEIQDKILLTIADNGIGTKQSDLPFLFEKGFTGDNDERKKKATGMGLYLVGQMARNLNIEVDVQSVYGQGFTLTLGFPYIFAEEK